MVAADECIVLWDLLNSKGFGFPVYALVFVRFHIERDIATSWLKRTVNGTVTGLILSSLAKINRPALKDIYYRNNGMRA